MSTPIGTTNQNPQTWTNENIIPTNQWHHIAVSLSNGIASIYIDGVYNVIDNNFNQYNVSSHYIEPSTADFLIGIGTDFYGSVTQEMNGDIDELSVWNMALDEQKILQYMLCPPNGDELGLIGYWNFDEEVGNTVIDQTSNANNGTINGAVYDTNVPTQSCQLTNSNGCDSTAVLNLTINQGDTSYTSVTACDSYTWNDSTYTQSGTFF